MKYYLYVSTSKVDMLFPQVPHSFREKISGELAFNLGVISGKVGAEAPRFDDVVSRLVVVERYLRKQNEVGDPLRPKEWFQGHMSAKTITFWTERGAVFFVGNSQTVTVALGGSSSNLLGGKVTRGEGPSFSGMSVMLETLERVVLEEGTETSWRIPFMQPRIKPAGEVTWESMVNEIDKCSRVPAQYVHFVARRLRRGRLPGRRAILGTPLYVALASDRPEHDFR